MKAVEDVRGGGGQDALGAEQILDRNRDAVERARLAAGTPLVARPRHVAGGFRGLGDEGLERPRLLHRGDIGGGQLASGKLLRGQPGASLGESEIGKSRHSTTLGTAKNPRALCGALPRISSRRLPSVTSSSRIGRLIAATLVIGGTAAVSTSASCSTHVRMCDSSAAGGSSSSSFRRMRARAAICATAALSNAINVSVCGPYAPIGSQMARKPPCCNIERPWGDFHVQLPRPG